MSVNNKAASKTIDQSVDAALETLRETIAVHEKALRQIDDEIAERNIALLDMQMAKPTRDELVNAVMTNVREIAADWQAAAHDYLKELYASNLVSMTHTESFGKDGHRNVSTSNPLKLNPLTGRTGSLSSMQHMTDVTTDAQIAPAALFAVFGTLLLPELEKWLRTIDLPDSADIPIEQRDAKYKQLLGEYDALVAKRDEIKSRMRGIYHLQSPAPMPHAVRETPTLTAQMAAATVAGQLHS